ncbi:hypothetical protein OG884_18770 [Streptosporangium sp. NBC_01755]|uniref:hypothetical protein n=1 Tax=Streptosporangium sp. NBC_01755 TaxID=2975949 RepID=UPI002DD837E3|nr:hypothetical protein [Streptosporangium sp. NBC_01755]WSD03852.1 hypothetical protein OG884_18770 [Streptosporangium sp. NBC_01755]
MGFAASLRESFTAPVRETWYRATGRAEQAEILRQERATVEHLQESIADLENRMNEPGWQHLTSMADQEFSREGLRQITAVVRVMALKNTLIKRGLALRTAYVWGQGVQISARANGKQRKGKAVRAGQDVNAVVQEFLADDGNRRTLTGSQASEENERALGTDGNLFFALFTLPVTGKVRARSIPWDEIADVITNPRDSSEVWFYKRVWYESAADEILGGYSANLRTAYYPALGYRPAHRPKAVPGQLGGDATIYWDAPVYHVKVGGLKGWKYGVPDAYAAIDWAQAYKEFLTDWARLIKSLSRFAWKLTSKGSRQAAARSRIAAGPAADRYSGEPQHAGATALMTPDMALEAVPKSGATIDSDSGRPLAAMVAAGLDVPVTMLLGDPGTTGARATAETLDTPTERTMELRRGVWTEMYRAILTYVIHEAVRAPKGALKGAITRDETGRETVTLDGDTEQTLEISWPDIDDVDVTVLVKAITEADGPQYLPPLVVARLLLEALGVEDIDEILDELTTEDGAFIPPGESAGQAAVDAFRNGGDPAALLAGESPDEFTEEPVDEELEPAEA